MSIEKIIEISVWIITTISLLLFIPKNKVRIAHVAFLIKQVITWLIGLLVVEMRLIEYPVRMFKYANRTSFTFEYFFLPAMCAFFNVYYPEDKSYGKKFLYYCSYCSAITAIEVVLMKYTHLIKYLHWAWYWTWITLFISFFLTRLYVRWFFRGR